MMIISFIIYFLELYIYCSTLNSCPIIFRYCQLTTPRLEWRFIVSLQSIVFFFEAFANLY